MASARTFDAAVVGGGIVGAAAALRLAEEGLKVVQLCGTGLPGSATAAGMGHVALMDDSEAQFSLGLRSQALWRRFLEEHGEGIDRISTGSTWIAADDEQWAVCQAKAACYRERGAEAELWDAQALAEAEPILRPGLCGALHLPEDKALYQPAAALRMAELAEALGARRIEGRAVQAEAGWVRTDSGALIEAGAVLLCPGADSALLPAEIPLRPRRGHLIATAKGREVCRSQIIELGYLASAHGSDDFSVAFNLQPRPGGQCLIGSSREFGQSSREPSRRVLARMLAAALSFAPGLAGASLLRSWTGLRPSLPDHLPAIGRHRSGLWLNAGHEGLGITQSLAAAEICADLILGRRPAVDPAPFSPDRFPAAA